MAGPAAAEQLHTYWEPEPIGHSPELPLVINVAEMSQDQLVRQRAEKFIRSLGSTLVADQVETIPPQLEVHIPNLMVGIHRAADGDKMARKFVTINVHTDAIERTHKAGHVGSRIEMETAGDGTIFQNGQTLEDVHANNFLYSQDVPKMRSRSKAETRNAFRIKNLNQQGILDEYNFVVWSAVADDMNKEELKQAYFYEDTMTVSIQSTGAENGKIITEPAFVAGVKTPGNVRHDLPAIIAIGAAFGVNYAGKSVAEIIDMPMLVHKSLMPNGVVDMVRLYDEAIGGTFFGEDKPQQDYVAYRQQCVEREKGFAPKVEQIVNELLSETSTIRTPVQAFERLNKISGKHMIEKAIEDSTIDSRVFGIPSSGHIEVARWHREVGNLQQAKVEISRAIEKDESRSCPGGAKTNNTSPNASAEDKSSPDSNKDSSNEGSNKDCEFISAECPVCGEKNVRTVVKRRLDGKKVIKGDCGCTKIY